MDAESFRRLHKRAFHSRFLDASGGALRAEDGRDVSEHREALVVRGGTVSRACADGSAVVRLANATQVIACVKAEAAVPREDAPRSGFFSVHVDLSHLGGRSSSSGTASSQLKAQDAASALAARLAELLQSAKCIDPESLCIEAGRAVWLLQIDVLCLAAGGNVHDAAILAVSAALSDVRLPAAVVTESDEVVAAEDTWSPLPLRSFLLPVTFAQVGDNILVDPTAEEEEVCTWRCTVVYSSSSGRACGVFHECPSATDPTTADSTAALPRTLNSSSLVPPQVLRTCLTRAESVAQQLAATLGVPWKAVATGASAST